ncbi:MAG: hypothetical protein PHS14_20350 [Elusimicrobia bacterium]|nr:hypothetical protein [Elusimicrobiota bacterium]
MQAKAKQAEVSAAARVLAKANKTPTPETPAPTDKTAADASVVAPSADASTGQGATPPEKPTTLDMSFISEKVRSRIHVDDDEALAELKNGYLAHPAATKKFQEASAMLEKAQALERDAQNYRDLVSDPDVAAVVAKAALDKASGKKPTPPEASVVDDLDTLDPKAVVARIDKSKVEAKAEALAELRAELSAPDKYRAAMNAQIGAYAVKHGVDQTTMTEAVRLAIEDLGPDAQVSPEQVPTLLPAYVRLARLTAKPAASPENKVAAPSAPTGTESVASPTGRAGPHATSVVPFPSHFVNGEPPRGKPTPAQYEQEMLFAARKRHGPQVTLEDLRAAMATR